jgi:hypothetical protein
MVANIYNSNCLGDSDQENHGLRPAGQTVNETLSQPTADMVVCTYDPSYTGGINRRIVSKTSPRQK